MIEGGKSMIVNGVDCITLGHGITGDKVAEHEYFGSGKIIKDLKELSGWENGLICLKPQAFKRNSETMLVTGIDQEAIVSY